MKLLVLTEFYPATDNIELTGGIEAVCYYVGKHLGATHDVRVRALRTDGSTWAFTAVSSLPRRIRFLGATLIASLFDEFDVVEGTNQLLHPVAWIVGRIRRRPVVYLYADVLVGQWHRHFGVVGWLGEIVERITLRLRPDHVIAISDCVRGKLIGAGVPSDRISVVHCGYDEELVHRIAAERPAKRATLVSVGRLVPYKGVDVVLRAMADLVSSGFDVTLLVIGQGPERTHLQRLSQKLGVADRVRFAGHLPSHADVLRAIAASEIFVSASRIEGFGIALVEAMALGVPYVASDIEAFREVTGGGQGGYLTGPGDPAEMAMRIAGLLTQPGRYHAAGTTGRAHAAGYTWAAAAAATREVLERLHGRRRPAAVAPPDARAPAA